MSHFTVTITGDPNTFDEQMAPFAEQEVRPEFLVFEDTEEENLKQYETQSRKEFYCSSLCSHGHVVSENIFKHLRGLKPGSIRTIGFEKNDMDLTHYWQLNKCYHVGCQMPEHKYPEEQVWVRVTGTDDDRHGEDSDVCWSGKVTLEVLHAPKEIPLKETYATFDDFMKDWHGSKGRDEKTGKYGYWTNPNSKWDYWRVGGRWAGHFQIKPEFKDGYRSQVPEFGWEWKDDRKGQEEIIKAGKVDSALKKHIDFAAMMDAASEKAAIRYDFVWEHIIKDTPQNEPWGEKFYDKEGGRDEYHAQPRVKAFSDFTSNVGNKSACEDVGLGHFTSVEEFNCTHEHYINRCRCAAVSTFALLHDGKWAARGEMGWWASVSNEQKDWEESFMEILATIPDDTRLTVLDCHV